jgi:hypothetical protein
LPDEPNEFKRLILVQFNFELLFHKVVMMDFQVHYADIFIFKILAFDELPNLLTVIKRNLEYHTVQNQESKLRTLFTFGEKDY